MSRSKVEDVEEISLKVIVYLCDEHAKKVALGVPMSDDVLICQVPTCFRLATWKHFAQISEQDATEEKILGISKEMEKRGAGSRVESSRSSD